MEALWSKALKKSVAEEARSQMGCVNKKDNLLYIPLFEKNKDECNGFLITKPENAQGRTLEEWARLDA